MDSLDHQVLHTAHMWLQEGARAVLVSVAKTWGSGPRPVGSMALIREDGRVLGSVSGGCIEEDLIARVRAGEFFDQPVAVPQVVRYGGSPDAAARFNLPCGGTLELVLEPLQTCPSWLLEALNHIAQQRIVRRILDLQTGAVTLATGFTRDDAVYEPKLKWQQVFGPRLRLVLIGAGQLSQATAQIAQMLDYAVIVCDPREEYAAVWSLPNTQLLRTMPDDTIQSLNVDGRTAIVALTHDPKLDDMALLEALKSSAFYVGALGSRTSQVKRKERLRMFDLSPAEIACLHGPVGLPIGARTPAEMAVSIMAEITAVQRHILSTPADETLPRWDTSLEALSQSRACRISTT